MVMPITLSVQRMRHGDGFNAYMLRNAQGVLDPFLGVDHAWMSAPTFPPHSHSGFSAVSYLFLDSETSIHIETRLERIILLERAECIGLLPG